MTARVPGAKVGRPKGRTSTPRAEPTTPWAIRVPDRVLAPFRAMHGKAAPARLVAFMERDVARAATRPPRSR